MDIHGLDAGAVEELERALSAHGLALADGPGTSGESAAAGPTSLNQHADRSTETKPRRGEVPGPTDATIASDSVLISDAGLSVRATNVLRRRGLVDLTEVAALTRDQLGSLPALGAKSLDEIERALRMHGLALATRPQVPLPLPTAEESPQLDEMAERLRRGQSVAEIATAHGISPKQVYRRLSATGLLNQSEQRPGRTSRPKRVDPRIADMAQRRLRGETLDDIGKAYNVTRERVRQILKQAGIDPGEIAAARAEGNRAVVAARVDDVLEAFRRGDDAATIARVLDLPPGAVAELLATEVTRTDRAARRAARDRPAERRYSDEDLIEAVRTVCERYGRAPTSNEYNATASTSVAMPSLPTIHNRIGWANAVRLAGFEPRRSVRRSYQRRWTEQTCLDALRRLAVETGHPPTVVEYEQLAELDPGLPSSATVRNRLGPWSKVTAELLRLPTRDRALETVRKSAGTTDTDSTAIWMAYLEEEITDDDLAVLAISHDFTWLAEFGTPPASVAGLLEPAATEAAAEDRNRPDG